MGYIDYNFSDLVKAARYCEKRGRHDASEAIEEMDDRGEIDLDSLRGITTNDADPNMVALAAVAMEAQMRTGEIR